MDASGQTSPYPKLDIAALAASPLRLALENFSNLSSRFPSEPELTFHLASQFYKTCGAEV
jgi:hypothetical protein